MSEKLPYEKFLEDYLGIDGMSFGEHNLYIILFCLFLFTFTVLRFMFWRISPVVYEAALILVFFGIGKIIQAKDIGGAAEAASDFISQNTLILTSPIYVFIATFEFNTAFGSYFFMFMLLVCLIPIFFVNLYFISWVMFVIFSGEYGMTFDEMLLTTLILSPIQVQYILDQLEAAQGRTSELKFKIRTEQYSSIWLSFVCTDLIAEYSSLQSTNQMNVLLMFCFVLYQGLGLAVGFSLARLVKCPLQKSSLKPHLTAALTVSSVYLIATSCSILGTSTGLGVGSFGIAVNAYVARYSRDTLEYFTQFWSFALFVMNSIVIATVGIILGFTRQESSIQLLRVVIVFYCLLQFIRLTLFFLITPLVNIAIGRKNEWRYATIQVVGLYKGGVNYLLALLYASNNEHQWYNVMLITVCFTMLSSLLNVLLFPMVLNIMGLFDYTAARISNMNIAMVHTNNCREKAIFALKMDKVVVDANWQVVEDITRLSHPYKRSMMEMNIIDDGRDDRQLRSVVCPDCKTEILAPPTKREIEAMKKEARERIIKSQQVSFHRQYEMGSLTTREYDFLSTIVENEMASPEPHLQPDKLKARSMFNKILLQLKKFLIWFEQLTSEYYDDVPLNVIRYWCFQFSVARAVRIIFAIITLLDSSFSSAQVIIYYFKYQDGGEEWTWPKKDEKFAYDIEKPILCFYGLRMIEFIISIVGLGVDLYFSRNVNKIEFGIGVVLGSLKTSVFVICCLKAGRFIHVFESPLIMLLKAFMPLRLAKLYILLIAIVPRVIARVDGLLADEMMRNYELGKAYLVALNRTSALLNRIVYSEIVYTELMKEIDEDRAYISRELGLIQNENPSIATTIKTRHAIRYVVNTMADCIKDMREEGVVDMIESEAITESLDKNREYLRQFTLISATPPEDILKNIPWLKDDPENLQYLLTNAQLFSHDYGDVLFRAGEDPLGIHLLVSGLLKSHYVPSTTTLQLCAKFGVLPNYDFFNNVKFDQPQDSFVVSGSIIGEIGAVSGRRYDMTITCETAAMIYHIPYNIVKAVIHESKDCVLMLAKIWKAISVKVALNILQYNVVSFQSWAPEKLLLYVNRGFVPILPNMVGLTVTTKIEVIILIEGVLMDRHTRKIYTGPCHIPKNIHELILPDHEEWDFQTIIETRMLIIPSNITNEEELRGPNGIFRYQERSSRSKDERGDSVQRKVGFEMGDSDAKLTN